MASPEHIARELEDVEGLMAAQVAAGLDREEVLQSLFNSWAARLSTCVKMNDKSKTMITESIRKGPWDPDQVRDLASIVLGKVGQKKSSKLNRRPSQKCVNFENFVTMECMAKLRDAQKYSRLTRCSFLASAARLIGLECPDAPTLYRMVSLLAYCEQTYDLSQDDTFKYMDIIQDYIKSVPRSKNLEYIEHYPSSASSLPADFQAIAYPDGVPPDLEIHDLGSILGNNKMRGRPSTGKSTKVPDWVQSVPDEYKDKVMNMLKPNSAPQTNRDTSSLACSSSEQQGLPNTSGTPLTHHADVFRFPVGHARHALTSAVEKSEGQDETNEQGEQPDQEKANTVEDLEEEFLARIRERRGGKCAAAKKKTAAADSVLKKPAAANSVLKKPAKSVPKNAVWKNIHSKIYAKTRKQVFQSTGDDSLAKKRASEYCARAKIKYLAGTLKC
jgi:hypothetical protein